MQLGIGFFQPLLPNVLADDLFTAMPPYGADKIALRPKLATPQLLLDRGHPPKHLSGGETFDHLDPRRWTIRGHRMDQEMDLIVSGADLHTHDFIPFGNLQTGVIAPFPKRWGSKSAFPENPSDPISFFIPSKTTAYISPYPGRLSENEACSKQMRRKSPLIASRL